MGKQSSKKKSQHIVRGSRALIESATSKMSILGLRPDAPLTPSAAHTTNLLIDRSYERGLRAKIDLIMQTSKLARLLERILLIATYSPKTRLKARLEQLAATEAGEARLETLAGEITKRYDVLRSLFTNARDTHLTKYDESIATDAKTIREAVLMLSRGDSSMLLRADVLGIAGNVENWQMPEVGRPKGMSEAAIWFCERLLHYRKEYPRGWWRSGLEVFREIISTPGEKWAEGHKQAYELLKNYISADGLRVEDRARLTKELSDIASRYKAYKIENESEIRGTSE